MKYFQENVAGMDAHETRCHVLASHGIPQSNQGIGEGMTPPAGTTISLDTSWIYLCQSGIQFTLGKLILLFCISEGPGYLLDAV